MCWQKPKFRVYLYTSMGRPRQGAMVAAVAQLYLRSMMFFAAREARAALGSAWRWSSPQLRRQGLGFRVQGWFRA